MKQIIMFLVLSMIHIFAYATPPSPILPNVNVLQTQAQIQNQQQAVQVLNMNEVNNQVALAESRRPVNAPFAASLFVGTDCMGSSQVGGSGADVSITFGTTWNDHDCKIFKAAAELEQAGYKADALVVRCQSQFLKIAPSCIAIYEAKTPQEKIEATKTNLEKE